MRLQLTATAPHARCPCCAVPSSSVHSRYQRHLTDLPWGARPVRIQLTVRKFVCQNPSCGRRIFTERLPDLVAAYARKTHRLVDSPAGDRYGPRRERRGPARRPPAAPDQSSHPAPPGPGGPDPAHPSPAGRRRRRVGLAAGPSLRHHPGRSGDHASWTCCRTARPPASRPGWPSIRRSPSSVVIAVTSMRTAFAGGHPRRCRWSTAFTSSRISARSWKAFCSTTDRRSRRPRSARDGAHPGRWCGTVIPMYRGRRRPQARAAAGRAAAPARPLGHDL